MAGVGEQTGEGSPYGGARGERESRRRPGLPAIVLTVLTSAFVVAAGATGRLGPPAVALALAAACVAAVMSFRAAAPDQRPFTLRPFAHAGSDGPAVVAAPKATDLAEPDAGHADVA